MIWRQKYLHNCYTMADITPTTSTPKDPKQRSHTLKGIDRDNLNDAAFESVTMFVFSLCCKN
jgi:hypothetical protein